jgi:hypothetical protein
MSLEEIITPLRTLWRFDYESNVKALRDLYEVAKREQWNAATDVPWDEETDPAKVGNLAGPERDLLKKLDSIQSLPEETRIELAKRRSAWTLSQFLHGEQGALLCCGQLVDAVPDIDGKLYAATQVVDEARHVEVFARYINRLDHIYPIMPPLKAVLDAILEADLWQMKCVGMQVIVESLAMGSFKMMRESTGDDVLRRIVELTSQDEARHVSYGLIYMKEELPRMAGDDRDRVEDFAWSAVETLGSPNQIVGRGSPLLKILQEIEIDLAVVGAELKEKFADPKVLAERPNPVRDYVVPQLNRIGLITERTEQRYRDAGLLN